MEDKKVDDDDDMHDCRCSTLRPIFLIVTPENPISSEIEGGEREGGGQSDPPLQSLVPRGHFWLRSFSLLLLLRQMMHTDTKEGKIVLDLHHQMSSLATKKKWMKNYFYFLWGERQKTILREMAELSWMKWPVVQYFTWREKVEEEANEQKMSGIAKKSWGVSRLF